MVPVINDLFGNFEPSSLLNHYWDSFINSRLSMFSTLLLLTKYLENSMFLLGFVLVVTVSLIIRRWACTTNNPIDDAMKNHTLATMNKNYMSSPRVYKKKRSWELDAERMVAGSTFKIKPTALIKLAQEVLSFDVGLNKEELLADDFVCYFNFPDVGLLNKTEYLEFMRTNELDELFPNENYAYCNYFVDPFNHNRVWMMSFWTGTYTKMPKYATIPSDSKEDASSLPVNTHVYAPPQMCSLSFNDLGQVTLFTAGYVMDSTMGNTGGLGGKFGPLYAINMSPFSTYSEGRPHKRSLSFTFGEKIRKLKVEAQHQVEKFLGPILVKD